MTGKSSSPNCTGNVIYSKMVYLKHTTKTKKPLDSFGEIVRYTLFSLEYSKDIVSNVS